MKILMAIVMAPLLSVVFNAAGQSYSISWFKIAGGGGTSSNGQYAVSGTIGQPDAGATLSGGNYSLTGGFWSLVSIVQTAGAPTLMITQTGNSVIVSWPSVSGWSLQQNSDLKAGTWTSTSYYVVNINGTNSISISSPSGNLFFRLSNP